MKVPKSLLEYVLHFPPENGQKRGFISDIEFGQSFSCLIFQRGPPPRRLRPKNQLWSGARQYFC